MSLGESYYNSPRVTSTYSRTMYEELEKVANNLDFRKPVFRGKKKRNRSLGSVQALIVELALNDDKFQERLREFMVLGGENWYPTIYYKDKY